MDDDVGVGIVWPERDVRCGWRERRRLRKGVVSGSDRCEEQGELEETAATKRMSR